MTIEINEQIARHIHHLEGLRRHLSKGVYRGKSKAGGGIPKGLGRRKGDVGGEKS